MKRKLMYSPDYMKFVAELNARAQSKLDYTTAILETMDIIPSKFVKKLVNTEFYELRVSVDNEIRVVIFASDNQNINKATKVFVLNGFIKKSTSDYTKEINRAITILRELL